MVALLADPEVLLELADVDQLAAAVVATANPEVGWDVARTNPRARREARARMRRRGSRLPVGRRRLDARLRGRRARLGASLRAVITGIAAEEITDGHDRVTPRPTHGRGERSSGQALRY